MRPTIGSHKLIQDFGCRTERRYGLKCCSAESRVLDGLPKQLAWLLIGISRTELNEGRDVKIEIGVPFHEANQNHVIQNCLWGIGSPRMFAWESIRFASKGIHTPSVDSSSSRALEDTAVCPLRNAVLTAAPAGTDECRKPSTSVRTSGSSGPPCSPACLIGDAVLRGSAPPCVTR